MSNHITLEIKGDTDFAGDIDGSGEITFELADAAEASILVDYDGPDELVLGIHSKVGLTLGHRGELTLSGGLNRDVLQKEFTGEVRADLTIDRRMKARIRQEWRTSGPKLSVALTVTF